MQCDGYDDNGNITYSFICDEFNSKYKILSQKYYLRNTKNEFDDSPYDILETIDFYDGTYFVKNIYIFFYHIFFLHLNKKKFYQM